MSRLKRQLRGMFRNTQKSGSGSRFANDGPCQCSPEWPALETTANGYMLPAAPSSNYSVLTSPNVGPFVARCAGCHARYPDPWVIPQGSPMPFDWAYGDYGPTERWSD